MPETKNPNFDIKWPADMDQNTKNLVAGIEKHIISKQFSAVPNTARQIIEGVLKYLLKFRNNNDTLFALIKAYENSSDSDQFITEKFWFIRNVGNAYSHHSNQSTQLFSKPNAIFVLQELAILLQSLFNNNFKFEFNLLFYFSKDFDRNSIHARDSVEDLFDVVGLDQRELVVSTATLFSLINNPKIYFEIPYYQRGYTWEEEQIEDFLSDISERTKDGELHYFGIFTTELTKFDNDQIQLKVIDGQQRLTTCLLFLKAIYDLDNADGNNKFPELGLLFTKTASVAERYINNTGRADNIDALKELLSTVLHGPAKDNPSLSNKGTLQIHANYDQMKTWLGKLQNNEMEEFIHHENTLKNQFVVALLSFKKGLKNREIEIFTNLNSKSKELSDWELIRTYLFDSKIQNFTDEDKVQYIEKHFEIPFKKSLGGDNVKETEFHKHISHLIKQIIDMMIAKDSRIHDLSNEADKSLQNSSKVYIKSSKFEIYKNFIRFFDAPLDTSEDFIDLVSTLSRYGQIYAALQKKGTSRVLGIEFDKADIALVNIDRRVIFHLVFTLFDIFAKWEKTKWRPLNLNGLIVGLQLIDIVLQRHEINTQTGESWREDSIRWAKGLHKAERPLLMLFNKLKEEKIWVEDVILEQKLSTTLTPGVIESLLRRTEILLDQEQKNPNTLRANFDFKIFHVMPEDLKGTEWEGFLRNQNPSDFRTEHASYINQLGNCFVVPSHDKQTSALKKGFFDVKREHLLGFSSLKLVNGGSKHKIVGLKEQDSWTFENIRNRTAFLKDFILTEVLSTKKILNRIREIEK